MIKEKNMAAGLGISVAIFLLIVGATAMGASPIFVRHAEVGPFASAFYRVFLALPLLWFWTFWENSHPRKTKDIQTDGYASRQSGFSKAVILGGLFFAGDLAFWHLAIMNTTVANATLMACLAPVWVALFSYFFIGESVEKNAWLGLGICLAGAYMLIFSSYQLAPERLIGDFYGIVTSIFFGLYFLAIRVARRSQSSAEVTLRSSIITTIVLFIIALFASEGFWPQSWKGVAALFALANISHVGGQGLLAVALGVLSATFSSLVIFVEALAGAFFGWLVFGEEMGALQLTGGFLILTGIFVARPRA